MATDDDAKLKATQQLNDAMAKQVKLLEKSTREMSAQLEISRQMQAVVSQAADLGDPLKEAKEVKQALSEIAEASEKGKDAAAATGEEFKKAMTESETSSQNFMKALQKVGKQFPVMKTAALAATHGIIEGFRGAVAVTSSFVKTAATVAAGIGKIGIAILSIPFKIFQGLIDKAESGGGGNELAAAYERVRKQFGDFKQDAAHNVIATAQNIDKQFNETGLNTFRVFGMLSERLELVNKIATAMGATWDVLGKEFATHAGHLLAYQKGLGVSEESMKDFGQAAIALGKPLQELMRETASLTLSMQKQFGGSAKLYSRDVSKMINDVKHFGGVSQKVMVETAVYTRKLGIETDKLLAMLDKFDTFDDAATSAAKLAQTYGANVDAFKLMTAESPVEQLDMIRKAMFEAGKSAENLDRKDFKYISTITGMDEATVRASLSMKNQGVSLDKVREGSAKAEKQQLSQAEAMKALAGAIERLTPSGGSPFGGFIKALLKGFNDGIERSQEFLQTMINIRRDMQIMYFAGMRIGKMFVDMFPGVKELLGGIRDLFDPAKFQKLANGLVDVFGSFFKDMTERPKVAFPLLMKALKEKFFDFFNMESGAGSKVISGFRKFMMALGQIAGGATKFLLESLRDGFKLITDLMSGKGLSTISAGASGAKKFLIDLFSPMFEALVEVWPSLKNAFITMISTAWEKIKSSGIIEKLWDGLKKYILGVGALSLGAGLVKGGGAAIIGGLTKGLGGIVAEGMGKMLGNAVKSAVSKTGTTAAAAGSLSQINKVLGDKPAESSAGMATAAKNLDSGAKQGINWRGIVGFLIGFAGVVAIGMAALWVAIKVFGDVPLEKLVKGLFVITGISLALLPAAAAIALIGKVKIDITSALMGIGTISLAVAAMALAIGSIYGAFTLLKVDFGKLGEFTKIILEMSKVFAITGLVVMEAMAVGAAMTLTGGILAGAALAGFAAIAAGVTAMATTTVSIMKSLEKVSFASGMQEKVDMFVKVLTAVTDFAKVYSDILTAAKPSFTQLLFGASKSTKDDLDAVTKFVSTMIGPPGGMIGIVTVVLDAVEKLGNKDENIRKGAEMMSGLLSAVASMAAAIAPPKELFSTGFHLIETGNAARDALQGSADYVKTMESSLGLIIDKVKNFIGMIKEKGITAEEMKTAAGVGQIFQAIAQITSALRVDPELIKAAKGANGDVAQGTMNQVGDLVRSQGAQIGMVVETISKSLTPVLKNMGAMKPEQVESLKSVTPLITSVLQTVTGTTQAFTGIFLSKNINTGLQGRNDAIKNMIGSVSDMIKGIGDQLPSIFDSLGKVPKVTEKGAVNEVKASLKVVRDMVSELNALSDMLSNDKLMKIDIAPKLEAMAKKVGLGGSGVYSIAHKPVTITVNLDIHMDAKEIEYGIVNRNGPGNKVVVTYDEQARKENK